MLQYGYQWVYFVFYLEIFIILLIHSFRVRLPYAQYNNGFLKQNNYRKFFVFLFYIPITVIAACRTCFIDTADYVLMYEHTLPDFSTVYDGVAGDIETGFLYFIALLNRITSDPQILFIISSIIIYYCFIKFIYDNCVDVPFALMIFLCQIWTDSMNGLRQFMVAGIVCLAWNKWVKSERKILNDILFVALIILCMQFHKSVAICAVVFLITRGRFFNIGTRISIAGTLLLVAIPPLYSFLFETVFVSDSYSQYENTDVGMSIMRLLVCSVPIVFVIINVLKNKEECYDPQNVSNWMMNIGIFSFCCSLLAMKMVYFSRLSIYFDMFNIVLIPNLIDKVIENKIKVLIKIVAFILYTIFFMYQMKAYGGYMNEFALCFLN